MNITSNESIRPADGYAGDIAALLAWQWVCNGQALIVDVRSEAERVWVGSIPGSLAVPWKTWPGMAVNANFNSALKATLPPGDPPVKLLMLCRSGVRSIAAAQAATAMGFAAYNILEGFEGDLNADGHRGLTGGWRKQGLPWFQG